jgi:hypothetical protein
MYNFVIYYYSVNATVVCLHYQNCVCQLNLYNIYIMIQNVRCAYTKEEIWIFSPLLLEDGNACVF